MRLHQVSQPGAPISRGMPELAGVWIPESPSAFLFRYSVYFEINQFTVPIARFAPILYSSDAWSRDTRFSCQGQFKIHHPFPRLHNFCPSSFGARSIIEFIIRNCGWDHVANGDVYLASMRKRHVFVIYLLFRLQNKYWKIDRRCLDWDLLLYGDTRAFLGLILQCYLAKMRVSDTSCTRYVTSRQYSWPAQREQSQRWYNFLVRRFFTFENTQMWSLRYVAE